MKQTLRFMLLMMLMTMGFVSAKADVETINFSDTNNKATTLQRDGKDVGFTFKKGAFTFTGDKANGANPAIQIGSAPFDLRVYAKGTLKVEGNGVNISQVVFTINTKDRLSNANTVDKGSLVVADDRSTLTWTATDETTQDFTITVSGVKTTTTSGKAPQFTIKSVEITYTTAGGTTPITVAAPTFSQEAGMYYEPFNLDLFAAEGNKIYYTLDGTEPTTSSTMFENTLRIESNTTVKAIAADAAGNVSSVASAVYTFPVDAANIKAFIDNGSDNVQKLMLDNARVLYNNGDNIYVKDASGVILFYKSGLTLTANQTVNGYVYGKYTKYNNTHELEAVAGKTTMDNLMATDGEAVEARNVAVADVTMNDVSDLIKLSDVSIVDVDGKLYAKVGEAQMQIFDKFKIYSTETPLQAGEHKIITGIVTEFKGMVQISPIKMVEDVPVAPTEVKDPMFSEEGGYKANSFTLTLTSEEGTTLFYTTDGSDPVVPETVNAGDLQKTVVIQVLNTMTVKAVAATADGRKSNVVAKTYTLPVEVGGIADFKAKKPEFARLTLQNAVVLYVYENTKSQKKEIFVRDGMSAINFYDTGLDLQENMKFSGAILCKYDQFNNLPEVVKVDGFTNMENVDVDNSSTTAPEPREVTLSDLTTLPAIYYCHLVRVKGVTYNVAEDGKTKELVSGEDKVVLYDKFGKLPEDVTTGSQYDVLAIVGVYKDTLQLFPIKMDVVTGIEGIAADAENAVIYNLSGQRVSKDYKGVVIINGKKVVLK